MFAIGIEKIPDDARTYIKYSLTLPDLVIEVGSVTYSDGNTDGLMRINGTGTNVLDRIVLFDDEGYEIFDYVGLVSPEIYLVVCKEYEYSDDFSLPVFRRTVVLKYNIDGENTGVVYLSENFTSYHNHNYHLVLTDHTGTSVYIDKDLEIKEGVDFSAEYLNQYDGQYIGTLIINGAESDALTLDLPGNYDIEIIDGEYTYEYRIIISPKIILEGEKFNDDFLGPVCVKAAGNLFIDGIAYQSGDQIDVAGLHQLTIIGVNGYSLSSEFLILPKITFVSDGIYADFMENMDSTTPLAIFSNGVSMLMDGKAYNSEIITVPGSHVLTIYGTNNYFLELHFRILPNVSGIVDGEIYDSVEISIFGKAYLNGQEVTGEIFIDTPGTYLLELYLDNDLFSEFSFIINDDINEEWYTGIIDNYLNYVMLLAIIVGAYLIFRKK